VPVVERWNSVSSVTINDDNASLSPSFSFLRRWWMMNDEWRRWWMAVLYRIYYFIHFIAPWHDSVVVVVFVVARLILRGMYRDFVTIYSSSWLCVVAFVGLLCAGMHNMCCFWHNHKKGYTGIISKEVVNYYYRRRRICRTTETILVPILLFPCSIFPAKKPPESSPA